MHTPLPLLLKEPIHLRDTVLGCACPRHGAIMTGMISPNGQRSQNIMANLLVYITFWPKTLLITEEKISETLISLDLTMHQACRQA